MTPDLEQRIGASLRRRADAIHVEVPEPDLRRVGAPARRSRRLELAAVAAALVLFVGAGVVLALAGRDNPGSTPGVAATVPTSVEALPETTVPDPGEDVGPVLTARRCRGTAPTLVIWMNTSATPAQIAAVDEYLRSADGIESYDYQDQDAAYEEFSELFADSPEMVDSVFPEDIPPSFAVFAPEEAARALVPIDVFGVKNVMARPCSETPERLEPYTSAPDGS
jgi:hypothetical protein